MKAAALFGTGLSGSAIKYIGIALMVMDHLEEIFAATGITGIIPQWFHWMGRLVLPVFLFLCAEAFWHTRSRIRYMLRLFAGFILMNMAYCIFFTSPPGNNVFQTLLLAVYYMFCIEMLRAGMGKKKIHTIAAAVALMLLPITIILLPAVVVLPDFVYLYIPNVLTTEGSFYAVALGALLYVFRENRFTQVSIIAALSIVSFILRDAALFGGSPQWLMVFAIVPLLLYNGKRGQGNTYFFYIFYPAHIFLLYGIAWLVRYNYASI